MNKVTTKPTANKSYIPPSGFVPFTAELIISTDKDGLICSSRARMKRYFSGNLEKDRQNPLKFENLGDYDPKTLWNTVIRFAMGTYSSNVTKRLPANQVFRIDFRVGVRNNTLKTSFKRVDLLLLSKKKIVPLTRDRIEYKILRKANRLLAGAFETILPPKEYSEEETYYRKLEASKKGFCRAPRKPKTLQE